MLNLILLFLCVGLMIYVFYDDFLGIRFEDIIGGVIFGFMLWFILTLILSLTFANMDFEIEYYKISETEIHSLKDNMNTQGNFFLGTGNVDEKLKYYFLKEKDGGKQVDSINAEDVIVFNDDDPKIIKYDSKFKNKIISSLTFPIDQKTYLYVPKNTIKTNYEIDLE